MKREFTALSGQIIGSAIEVHRHLGPGLLESIYRRCLARELELRGIPSVQEVLVPIHYKGLNMEMAYRADLFVDQTILVELKCVDKLAGIHRAQALTYMRLLKTTNGLLVNFNVPRLAAGGIVSLIL